MVVVGRDRMGRERFGICSMWSTRQFGVQWSQYFEFPPRVFGEYAMRLIDSRVELWDFPQLMLPVGSSSESG